MKNCPDWKSNKDYVQPWWKQELLQYLGSLFNIKTLIETGTCYGGTSQRLSPHFKTIHTIELSEHYFETAVKNLRDFPNVICYRGDSRERLPEILDNTPDEPVLFWLDAHDSGGLTANAGDPLAEELKIIMAKRPVNALVVVDDMADGELRHCVNDGIDFAGWIREYRTGEVIVYPEGRYQIPTFEEWTD